MRTEVWALSDRWCEAATEAATSLCLLLVCACRLSSLPTAPLQHLPVVRAPRPLRLSDRLHLRRACIRVWRDATIPRQRAPASHNLLWTGQSEYLSSKTSARGQSRRNCRVATARRCLMLPCTECIENRATVRLLLHAAACSLQIRRRRVLPGVGCIFGRVRVVRRCVNIAACVVHTAHRPDAAHLGAPCVAARTRHPDVHAHGRVSLVSHVLRMALVCGLSHTWRQYGVCIQEGGHLSTLKKIKPSPHNSQVTTHKHKPQPTAR